MKQWEIRTLEDSYNIEADGWKVDKEFVRFYISDKYMPGAEKEIIAFVIRNLISIEQLQEEEEE